jgi:hypothetical protein
MPSILSKGSKLAVFYIEIQLFCEYGHRQQTVQKQRTPQKKLLIHLQIRQSMRVLSCLVLVQLCSALRPHLSSGLGPSSNQLASEVSNHLASALGNSNHLASALGNSNHQASKLLASALRENNRLSTSYTDQVKLFWLSYSFLPRTALF